MVTYGYAKDYHYTNDGTLEIRVRIPSIHGPMSMSEYQGNPVRNYTLDQDLPYYPSVLLPHLPNNGEIVVLSTINDTPNQWLIIGTTGGYFSVAPVNSN